MIRSVIALFVFALLLCGWIVLRSTTGQPAPEVTRAATQDLAAPAQPSALRQRLQQQVAPAAQPVAPVAALTPVAPQPAQAAPATAEEIQRAVQVALAPVKRATAVPATPVQQAQSPANDPMAQGVLANIRQARGLDQPAAAQPASVTLTDVVSQAIAQGQSDAYVEALLGAAHDEGLFEVDDALKTEDGRVDTRTLLSQIVHRASASASAPAAAVPAPEAPIVGGAGVEIRTIQRADKTETYRFYTVQSGDSLGFIAQKFYGDAGYYTKIWEANRQIVSSPDRIRKGQRLVIPNI